MKMSVPSAWLSRTRLPLGSVFRVRVSETQYDPSVLRRIRGTANRGRNIERLSVAGSHGSDAEGCAVGVESR